MQNINIFYVYVYCDPRKPLGSKCYGTKSGASLLTQYEPFYVGKGKGYQNYSHLKEAKNQNCRIKHPKTQKIQKLLREGMSPIIITSDADMSEDRAFQLEIELIQSIGRSDLGLGPLTNLTHGGEGVSGLKMTSKSKLKMSETKKKNYKEKPELKKKFSMAANELWNNVEKKNLMLEKRNKVFQSEEYKLLRKTIAKELWHDPLYRSKTTESTKKAMNKPEVIQKIKDSRYVFKTEDARKKMSEIKKRNYEDNPELKNKISEQSKRVWSDPKYKEKMSLIQKEVWKTKSRRKK